ncbi:sensor histidine kinase [Aliidiomarina haloalkalitolerans]|uniref:histidine kinase n=1 Tax=Aliidiomarina haloalkalitolerans TaxID=859059 RepID=A0A432VVU5_9GAMM|nr:HAMP domain-containing sensor histidine kinase [Aliidiomarina haloalkalitolerans]RUO20706.1 hypothetical protein CWE06_05200 [Aliidiomarina haloalkalitolerans]
MRDDQQATKLYIQFLYVVTLLVFIASAFFYRAEPEAGVDHFWLTLALFTVLTAVATVTEQRGTTTAQVLGLAVLWVIGLSHAGGVTSPVNALLLILLVVAFLQLRPIAAWGILAFILSAQGYFIVLLDQGAHGHSEHRDHYLGMGFTFILAAILLAITLRLMRNRLERSQQQLQKMRETQLRREQIVGLATASAQITHEIATPLAMLSLLHEELQESFDDNPAVHDMREPLARVKALLTDLRSVSQSLNQDELQKLPLQSVLKELKQHTALSMPTVPVNFAIDDSQNHLGVFVYGDRTLMPALLNLIRNAAHEVEQTGHGEVVIQSETRDNNWHLIIRNPNYSLTKERLAQLGQGRVVSQKGLGIGLLLSHATLERMGGTLEMLLLDNHDKNKHSLDASRSRGFVEQHVRMPLVK